MSSLLLNTEHFTPYFLRIVKARILERHHTSFFFVDYKVKIRNDLRYAVQYWLDSQSNESDDITFSIPRVFIGDSSYCLSRSWCLVLLGLCRPISI